MIRHILAKDWKLTWPMVLLVTAIQVGLEWAGFGENAAAAALLRPLTLAWYLGIAALAAGVVLQDPIPGVDQDWLIRPLSRTRLLFAKLAFVVLTVGVPMFVLNMTRPLAMGFPLALSLEVVLYKEVYLFACFILPVMALAAVTHTMSELIAIGAVLVVVYAVSLSVSAFFFGADWCPTCDSGLSWLQHVLQHAGVLVGAVLMLALQYYRRRTAVARAVAVIGAAALVFIQLPWNTAFALQTRFTGTGGAAAPTLEFEQALPSAESVHVGGRDANVGAKQTTALLLRGQVDQALQSLRRHAPSANGSLSIDLPLRVQGMSGDELLLVDRLELRLVGEGDRVLYTEANAGAAPDALVSFPRDPGVLGPLQQTVEIPAKVYREFADTSVQLHLQYDLTLVKERGEYRLAALGGVVQAAGLGRCSSRLDQDVIDVGCWAIGRTPFCFGATVYSADGRHNPEALSCTPDYRPFLPAPSTVLSSFGVGVRVHDRNGSQHYAVDLPDLATAHVIVRLYEQQRHFRSTLVSSRFVLGQPAGEAPPP